MSGPVVGIPTLLVTQNAATAQKAANYESAFTAGAGLVNPKTTTGAIQAVVDFGLSAMGLASDGCQ